MRRLESWKEIAAHLGRKVRTVQRWEREELLPVHRHQHRRRGTVYAFDEELDTWRASRADEASPDGASEAPERRSSQGWLGWLVGGGLGLALLLGLALRRPRPEPSRRHGPRRDED